MCIVFNANYVVDDIIGTLLGLGTIGFLIWQFFRMMNKLLTFLVRKRRKAKNRNNAGRIKMKQRFLVVYEHGKRNYSGFVPDILGCVSTGKTLEKMREMMREAIEIYLEGMAKDGDEMPTPATFNVDFKKLDDLEEGEVDHYIVEWLEIDVPVLSTG